MIFKRALELTRFNFHQNLCLIQGEYNKTKMGARNFNLMAIFKTMKKELWDEDKECFENALGDAFNNALRNAPRYACGNTSRNVLVTLREIPSKIRREIFADKSYFAFIFNRCWSFESCWINFPIQIYNRCYSIPT